MGEPRPKQFRDYAEPARDTVRELYRLNHEQQTVALVKAKQAEFSQLNKCQMSVWEALSQLDSLVDDSDPDTELSQLGHALQTAEAARADGQPRWLILAGLIHDLGKVLYLFGEPQWAVVGDTFPVGCHFSDKIVYPELFAGNPDQQVAEYQTELGIYSEHCGLDKVLISWGHDEYLYYVMRDYLPDEALYMIRYHSFYALHKEGEYQYLLNDYDRQMIPWLHTFNPYDLYSKADAPPVVSELKPFYEELIAEFLPEKLNW